MSTEVKAIKPSYNDLIKEFNDKSAKVTRLHMRSYHLFQSATEEKLEIYQKIVSLTVEKVLNAPIEDCPQIIRDDSLAFISGTNSPKESTVSFYESVLMEILKRISPIQQN